MSILDVVAYDRNDGKLARVKEVKLAHHYQHLPYDVVKSSVGTFMLEVSRQCIMSGGEHDALFDFLQDQYTYLDQTEDTLANMPLRFLLLLSSYLGFTPDNNYADGHYFDLMEGRFAKNPISAYYIEPKLALLVNLLMHGQPSDVSINAKDRGELLKALTDYYRLHIESFKPLKSLPILREIL
jgi:DNA repair protein RecO (recombination protein O)